MSFVNGLDPNHGGASLPVWPTYAEGGVGRNMVLNSNDTYVEEDTFREEGIAFINSISRELLA